MGYERVTDRPETVYHYTNRKKLESILHDGRIKRMGDTECWFCPTLEDTLTLMRSTVMIEGKPYYKVGGTVGFYPKFVPEDYVILKLTPRWQSGEWVRWMQELPPGSPPELLEAARAFSNLKLGFRGDLKFYPNPEIIKVASLLAHPEQLPAVFTLYCPAGVYFFEGMTIQELYEQDVFDEQSSLDDALVEQPVEYAGLLADAMQDYTQGRMDLDEGYSDSAGLLEHITETEIALVSEGGKMWLRVDCGLDHPLSDQEAIQLKTLVADNLEAQRDTVTQWGWIETETGALLVDFEPVPRYAPSCGQPSFSEMIGVNNLLTCRELLEQFPDHSGQILTL